MDESLFDLDEVTLEREQTEFKWRIPGHLRQPITPDEVNFLLFNLGEKLYYKRHKKIQSKVKELNFQHSIYSLCRSPLSCLKRYIEDLENHAPDKIRVEFKSEVESQV